MPEEVEVDEVVPEVDVGGEECQEVDVEVQEEAQGDPVLRRSLQDRSGPLSLRPHPVLPPVSPEVS